MTITRFQVPRRKRPGLFFIIFFICILLTIAIGLIEYLISPTINKNKLNLYDIRGKFPYAEGFNLILVASFRSNNLICRKAARVFLIFKATDIDRAVEIPLVVKKSGTGDYYSTVALDYYSPGFCDWGYAGLGYRFEGGHQADRGLHGLGPFPTKFNGLNLQCKYIEVKGAGRKIVSCGNVSPPYFDEKKEKSSEINFYWN